MFLREVLAGAGIALADHRHPILGMLLAGEAEARSLEAALLDAGLWVPYFKYASEPRHNLLRGAARAVYTGEHLARFEAVIRAWNGGKHHV